MPRPPSGAFARPACFTTKTDGPWEGILSTNICFYVQTHRDPGQILRLVRTLHRGSDHARVVVQHNFDANPLDWTPFAELPRTHLIGGTERQIRAHYSCQMQQLIHAIDWLDREDISYDWLVTLTGQDYPLVSTPDMEEELAAATCDGFIRWWDVFSEENPWSKQKAVYRYGYQYRILPAWTEWMLRAVRPITRILPLYFYVDYGAFFGWRARRTPFNDVFRLYGGWAWFSLRQHVVRYVRDQLAAHPELVAYYRNTVIPEESLVQTVLINSGRFNLVNDNRRYIDYANAHRGSPRILTASDLPMLAAGRYHFARKFDPAVDARVLDRIDRELLGMS